MNRLSLYSLALGALLAAGCSPAPQTPRTDAQEDLAGITALRQAVAQGYGAGEAARMGALYTDDAVSQGNGQATATGRAAIVATLEGLFSQFTVKMDISPDETHTSGVLGYERGRFTMTLTPKAGGEPAVNQGRYSVILRKSEDGTWRIARDMDNVAAAP